MVVIHVFFLKPIFTAYMLRMFACCITAGVIWTTEMFIFTSCLCEWMSVCPFCFLDLYWLNNSITFNFFQGVCLNFKMNTQTNIFQNDIFTYLFFFFWPLTLPSPPPGIPTPYLQKPAFYFCDMYALLLSLFLTSHCVNKLVLLSSWNW